MTDIAPAKPPEPSEIARPPSTTRRTLRWLLIGLLAATTVAAFASVSVLNGTNRAAQVVRTQSAPSILELAAVRTALVRANASAIDSFQSGQARLAGPGEEYQNQIAAASQSLAQAAEDVRAGTSSRKIQLVEVLLVTYTGLIGQAAAHYRQDGLDGLATTYLWYAFRLLYARDVGIVAQLDALESDENKVLVAQLSSGWLSPAASLLWLTPMLIVLFLLIYAQRFLRQRFRRSFNVWLLLATAMLSVAAGGMSFALVAKAQLADARGALSEVMKLSREQFDAIDATAQKNLADLLTQSCATAAGDCGVTVASFKAARETKPALAPIDDNRVSDGNAAVNREASSATTATSGALVGLVATSAVGLFIWLGLRRRLEEYRYRAR